jgi:hypothetical protein
MLEVLFALVVAHGVCDFVLQPDAMGSGKNHRKNRADTNGSLFPPWPYWMGAHALTHGGGVYMVTGSVALGIIETALHATIDYAKCDERIGVHSDQLLHLGCKVGYALGLTAF